MTSSVTVIAVSFEGWIHEAPEGVKGLPLFHCHPDDESFRALRDQGFDVRLVPRDSLPLPCVLLRRQTEPERLIYVTKRLLGPGGCPWDQEQTHESLKKHLLEEAYEVFEAIDSANFDQLREELGDLALQAVMHAAMAERDGEFSVEDVYEGIASKLIRRHPHVFGQLLVSGTDQVLKNWDAIKKSEKGETASILGSVPASLPALLYAFEISKRAARTGFEWPDIDGVFLKFHEELNELKEAHETGTMAEISSEVGDLLFTVVNLARWMKVDSEDALRQMVLRFKKRFEEMERLASKPLTDLTFEEWDSLWNQAKLNLSA